MKKSKWHDYWQKRAVKAELALTTIGTLAESRKYTEVEAMVRDYYQSVAAGEVKDTPLDGDSQS